MNELIEIITLCAKCLLQFSPKLMSLLCDVEFNQNNWTPFIDVQFGAPKINNDSFQQLSFGTVLSSIAFFVKALNLQHHSFKQAPLNQLPAEDGIDGSETVSMASFSETAHQRALGLSPAPPLSPRRPFSKSLSMNSVSSSIVQASNELLSHLDSKICVAALEFMLALLASQSLLALKNLCLSSRDKQLIRRELSNELYCFHDFVKKKILKDSSKSAFYRQKFGISTISNQIDDDDDQQPGTSRTQAQRRSKDLRVNVVRKLHLQQKSSAFEIPTTFSPIPHLQSKDHIPIDSTPLRSSSNNPSSSTTVKRVGFDLTSTASKVSVQEDDEPYVVNRADPSFTGLSFVKMVEEDYLHLLSNLFVFICQNEN
jgi:nuclear pore complex protein Nup188